MCKKAWVTLLSFIFLIGLGCSTKSERPDGQTGGKPVRLTGTVDTNGAPRDGVLITATDVDYVPGSSYGSYTAQTNSDGAYSMSLPAGVYNVVASGRDLQKAVRGKVRLLGATSLDFVLTPTGDLKGRITYHQSPQAGLIIFLYGTQFMATTDSKGEFLIRGIPGNTYRIGLIVPDEDGGTIPLAETVTIEAGITRDMGTIEGADIERFAYIDYVNPGQIESSRDPNHPIIIHRYQLGYCPPSSPGVMVKFGREMNPDSVRGALHIEAPPAFEARGLHWEYKWGYYYEQYDEHEGHVWEFYPSPCRLTIIPRDEHDKIAVENMPVGRYVIRLDTTVKDTCGDPLYRPQTWSFEIREMMLWEVNDHFLANGVTGIDVGYGVHFGSTNAIDQNSVDLDTDLTITPELPGKEVVWEDRSGFLIKGMYAEGTTYTFELEPGIRTIYGDPFINTDPVTGTFKVQFTTAAPRVASMFPDNGSKEFSLTEPVILVFNTITDRDSVEEHIHVYDDTNKVEILPYTDANGPCPSYRLNWLSAPGDDHEYYYKDPCYSDYGPGSDDECEGCGLGSECGDSEDSRCCENIGDNLSISFSRQYNRSYRVELDGNAVSFLRRGKIAAFSGLFRTIVPRLVEWDIEDGETIDDDWLEGSDGLWFRYNVDLDVSEATITLLNKNTNQTIPVDIETMWDIGGLNLTPAELPDSSDFMLTLQGIKADNGYPIPDETFNFSTQRLHIVDSDPYNGEVNYDFNNHFVSIRFNGQLTEAMKQAIEQNTQIVDTYYGPEVDANTVPDNYPEPLFVWNNWKFDWTELQIAFTMDPCTNYKIYCDPVPTDPVAGVTLYDYGQVLTFSTMCPEEMEPSLPPPLVYRTEPSNGAVNVSLYNNCFSIYLATPISAYPDIEVMVNGDPIYFNASYWTSSGCPSGHMEPWGWTCDGSWSSIGMINVCIDRLWPSATYQVTVKNVQIDQSYGYPFYNNLPYTFSFTTEPPQISAEADNDTGVLTFSTNAGYFKLSDLQDPNIVSFQPDLRTGGEWKVYMDQNEVSEYGNMAELHYQPVQYALIKTRVKKSLDYWGDPNGIWTLYGQFANTPREWIFNVNPDIILPKLVKVEHEPDRYDFLRLDFNVGLDSETALDPNNYSITYVDGNGVTVDLGVQGVWDYDCYTDEMGDTNQCDPAYAPPMLEDQLILKTDPQDDGVEYTLQVSGVKEYGERYEILPEDGVAGFWGRKYPGRVEESYLVETVHDIRSVFDYNNSRTQWKSRAKKFAIHFDVPMDPNVAHIGQQINITPSSYSGINPSAIEQDWYDDHTTTVITYYYEVEPDLYGNYYNNPPAYFNISISDECLNAEGKKLENTEWYLSSRFVDTAYYLNPTVTSYLDPNNPFDQGDPDVAVIKLDYSSYTTILAPEAVGISGSYRLADPNRIDAPDGGLVSDPNGYTVTVTSVENNWPSECLLKLSGYPESSIGDVVLVYSDIPYESLPWWFPKEALKDVGYARVPR